MSMRASRFRWRAGLLPMNFREESQALKTYLVGLINPVNNSIRPFGRDLTMAERRASKAANSNKWPQRRRKTTREAEARELERVSAQGISKANLCNT